MRHYFKHIIILILLTSVSVVTSCEGNALFSQLMDVNGTDGLKVVFKGTYASNNPRDWGFPGTYNDMVDNSVDDIVGTVPGTVPPGEYRDNAQPTIMYIDIAEMRLLTSSDYSLYLSGSELKDEAKFSTKRQTFKVAVNNSDAFFNGTGISLKCQDIKPDTTYKYLLLYIRGLAFDEAYKYTPVSGQGWNIPDPSDITDYPSKSYLENFREEVDGVFRVLTSYEGFDFNQYSTLSSFDKRTDEYSYTNKVFPLVVEISNGLTYVPSNGKHTLEVRLVVKNFIKKFEYTHYSTSPYIAHFFALSDWAAEIEMGDSTFGGNYHATAITFADDTKGTITVEDVSAGDYVILIPASHYITDYQLNKTTAVLQRDTLTGNFPSNPDSFDSSVYNGTYLSQSSNFELILDYFVNKEIDREKWNNQTATDYSTYSEVWQNYNSKIINYKIPPYAIYAESGGNFVIKNVAPGSYKLYIVDIDYSVDTNYGTLISDASSVTELDTFGGIYPDTDRIIMSSGEELIIDLVP